VAVEVSSITTDEGDTTYTETVIVTLSGPEDEDVTFSYSTFDGIKPAAHAGSDYTAVTNAVMSGDGSVRRPAGGKHSRRMRRPHVGRALQCAPGFCPT